MNKTNIEYLDYTWNITHGCSPVSPGCNNCWAEVTAKRIANMGSGARGYSKDDPFKVVCCPWELDEPLKIKKSSRIGVSFMGDLFHEDVPDEFIIDVWKTMLAAPWHTFLILTKRPARLLRMIGGHDQYRDVEAPSGCIIRKVIPSNLWLGVTAENQEQADKRIPILLQIPAAKRFVSIEPMLGAVDFQEYNQPEVNINYLKGCDGCDPKIPALDWVIVGAESGAGKRFLDNRHVRDVVFQCRKVGIPIFIKQLHDRQHLVFNEDRNGFKVIKNMAEWPEDLRVRQWPD